MSTGLAKRLAAYWDWATGAVVPDARIVVCAPGVMTDEARVLMWVEYERGRAFVVDVESDPPGALAIHPGLNVRTQADLARLSALLWAPAKRRALVVSPEEAIDLDPLVCEEHGEAEIVNGDDGATPFCGECPSGEEATEMGSAGYLDGIDVVFIVGTDKPMRPDWVRSIVEQCRKAGVPVILVTWGEWMPTSQRRPRLSTDAAQRAVGCMKFIENEAFLCVGAEHSGAMLDGQSVEDVPRWLGGAHG